MSLVPAVPKSDLAEFARETEDCRKEVTRLLRVMHRLLPLNGRGIGAAIKEQAALLHLSSTRLRAIYDQFRVAQDWRVLINRRNFPAPGTASVLPPQLIELWKTLCERNQRKCKPAYRELLRMWERGVEVEFEWPALDPITEVPAGCTYRNLLRHAPTKYELQAARVGRSSASQMLPKVLTTRIGIEVGQVYVNDDQEYDVQVAFEGVNRKGMRPVGFNTLDYASACDVLQTYKPVVIKPDGSKEKLRQIDYQWHVVSLLTTEGYREDTGTLIIDEHGTAKAGEKFWERVSLATDKKVTFSASGIHGEQVAGMFRGSPRGNPRFKAARESWFNLLRNEMAALPGQSGMDRHHAPEENYGLELYLRDLLDAITARPDLAEALILPVMRWSQFGRLIGEIVHRINQRWDHELEGWTDDRFTDEWRLDVSHPWMAKAKYLQLPTQQRTVADSLIASTPGLWRTRRMSPWAVWESGRSNLVRIEGAMIPVLLGPDGARPATVTNDHHLVVEDVEIEPEAMWFDAELTDGRILQQGQKVLVYLNPFVTTGLEVCDLEGRWIGTAPRVHRISKIDVENLQRRYGEVRRIEGKLLAPMAARGASIIRERTAMRENNATKLDGRSTAERKRDERRQNSEVRLGELLIRNQAERDATPATTPADESSPKTETWDAPTSSSDPTPKTEIW